MTAISHLYLRSFPHVTVSYGEVVNFWEYIFIDIHSVIEEMFPNNTAFQNEAVTTISKKAFMTNVYQSPAMAEYINDHNQGNP